MLTLLIFPASNRRRCCLLAVSLLLISCPLFGQWDFQTKYLKIKIDNKGYITSMKNNSIGAQSYNREFSPTDKPSPLLCLYAFKKKHYYLPQSASYAEPDLSITYSNGIVAVVEIKANVANTYLRLRLKSLSERKDVDDIQWGPVHTNITNIVGEVISVAKDTSDAVNYAIGMFAMNDNTSSGPSHVGLDPNQMYNMYVQAHSPHPSIPLPPDIKEGQRFALGGDCDGCFYHGVKDYLKYFQGFGAEIDDEGRITVYYHSPDRRKPRTISIPYRPFESNDWKPSHGSDHIDVPLVPTEDCVGSTVAFYGAPEDVTLKEVLEKAVLDAGMMHLTTARNGSTVQKWIKDPARIVPAVQTYSGNVDFYKLIEYTDKLGFTHIQTDAGGYFTVNRANNGFLSGTFNTTEGRKPYKEVCDRANAKDISIGLHSITNAVRFNTSDVTPVPSEHLACIYKRKLVRGICSTDVRIEVENPLYLSELASWESYDTNLNYIKIGTEIIKYMSVSENPPYILQGVQRGAHGTTKQSHLPGAEICRLSVTFGYGYEGFIPDLYLLKLYGEYYADVAINTGIRYTDFDGIEFLNNSGHGQYAYKVFLKAMQQKARDNGIPILRFSGSGVGEGSWLYQTVANFGSSGGIFDDVNRTLRPQGIAMNNTALGNFFAGSFSGSVPGIKRNSTVQHFENLQAMSVGMSASYGLNLKPDSVESCPVKEQIFTAIKTWERARAANAFPREALQKLRMPAYSWHLEETDNNTWKLYKVNSDNTQTLFKTLTRDPDY